MNRTTSLFAAAALSFGLATAASAQNSQPDYMSPRNPFPHIQWQQLGNNCEFGEQIDGTSATDAKRRIEASGYTGVRDLRKGCDNVWHGRAKQGGFDVNIALEPSGQVFRETE